jgi:hypothetical protein
MLGAMLLDRVMPHFDAVERHAIEVPAPAARVYPLVLTTDFGDSAVIRTLFRLRGLPARATTLAGAIETMGFVPLAETPGEEIVIGLAGRFWTIRGGVRRLPPAGFAAFDEPGYAVAAWNFTVEPRGATSVVATETRVRCTDRRSRRFFRAYWTVVGPFSAWTRREMLRLIAARAAA